MGRRQNEYVESWLNNAELTPIAAGRALFLFPKILFPTCSTEQCPAVLHLSTYLPVRVRVHVVCMSCVCVPRAWVRVHGAGAGSLASPVLFTTATRVSARSPPVSPAAGPRGARSSGAWSAGCAAQPASLRAPLMRRGAAGGDAAAHAALRASPSCPRRVADATCCSRLPCPSLPSRKQTHTHTHTHTHCSRVCLYACPL